jgi:hypothetical protein
LLEGDFNYFNTTIFARQMTVTAQEKGQIPIKCYAKKGSKCVNAVIIKIMNSESHGPITTPCAFEGMTLVIVMIALPTPLQAPPSKAGEFHVRPSESCS